MIKWNNCSIIRLCRKVDADYVSSSWEYDHFSTHKWTDKYNNNLCKIYPDPSSAERKKFSFCHSATSVCHHPMSNFPLFLSKQLDGFWWNLVGDGTDHGPLQELLCFGKGWSRAGKISKKDPIFDHLCRLQQQTKCTAMIFFEAYGKKCYLMSTELNCVMHA